MYIYVYIYALFLLWRVEKFTQILIQLNKKSQRDTGIKYPLGNKEEVTLSLLCCRGQTILKKKILHFSIVFENKK